MPGGLSNSAIQPHHRRHCVTAESDAGNWRAASAGHERVTRCVFPRASAAAHFVPHGKARRYQIFQSNSAYLDLCAKCSRFRNHTCSEYMGTSLLRVPGMDAPTCAPNGRILVVDDNARALRAMSELLQFEGFSVLTAQNGLDALNKMKAADHVSLVLLDLWMPVMDGWEVLRRKKGDPDLANVPVVVISAIPPVDLDGVESVLTKPIDLNQLMETVRHFV
jgi:two-component system, OmpR family, response regulator CpxR